MAIELVADRASRRNSDPALRLQARIKQAALAEGLAVYPMGGTIDGETVNHLLIAPPDIVSEDEVALAVDRLGRAVGVAIAALWYR